MERPDNYNPSFPRSVAAHMDAPNILLSEARTTLLFFAQRFTTALTHRSRVVSLFPDSLLTAVVVTLTSGVNHER